MCTLIVFHQVWEGAPLVLAVNRDEAYDRPTSPPAVAGSSPAVLMPRDERAGGTWMGANASGLWVGLTNREGIPEDPARRSRGLLCADLLRESRPEGVVGRLLDLGRPCNPFNLVTGDGLSLWLVEHDGERSTARRLAPGIHVVTNRPCDETRREPKAARARTRLEEEGLCPERLGGPEPEDLEERLGILLGDHGTRGHDALCLHGGRYGTRSGAVWRVGGPETLLAYADGPPCATPFERFRLGLIS